MKLNMASGRGFAAGLVGVLVAALVIFSTPRVLAIQDIEDLIQRQRNRIKAEIVTADEDRLKPVVDRDAERWLARAAEAASREDWKLAADTLGRVIDDYGDRTVASEDGRRFYSAAKVAREQLMEWPPEGVRSYRVLYDAEARGLYETAKQAHDLDKLRTIARKYPMTTIAPEALDLLANWLLDRGGGGEALDVLSQLEALPHSRIPRWRNIARQAVAYAMTDQPVQALARIDALREMLERGDGSIPADGAERIEQVASFVERCEKGFTHQQQGGAARSDVLLQSWPWALGPAHVGGRMLPTNPAVTPEEFWRDALPGTERIDLYQVNQLIAATGRPPVWQCASDGRAIFVTSPDGVMARDLATFDLLWRSVPRARPRDLAIMQHRLRTGSSERDNRERLDELSTVTLFHEYRGAVSYGHGLVFVIEQRGTTGERFPSRKGVVDYNENFGASGQVEPNSLRAFEHDTGRAVWTLGRGGPADDELRFVHFYGPPVTSGEHLLTIYQAGSDLNLAVLSPDGRVLRKVMLGSAFAGLFPMNGVLQPTIHDGTAYVPTGAGMLIALNAFDFSLRWLASYDRVEFSLRDPRDRDVRWPGRGRSRRAAQHDEWLSTPPLVVAGLVILAPHDSNRLLAFERQTGKLKWSHPRESWRYLVAGDHQSIFVAGMSVGCIDTDTGLLRWHNEDLIPTGRPALCGDDLLVPTQDGLVRLDAQSGEQSGAILQTSQPMGNLLALDGALYSVTPTSISKFPDVEQSRQMAVQTLERDPDDLSATLRLAWLASIERQWDEALQLLDRSERLMAARPDTETAARVVHQRVEVLLNLAAESPAEARAEILQRASDAARRSDDRIRTSLAMAELLVEQGQIAESFMRIASLLGEWGDEPTSLETHLDARGSVLIRERLSSLWHRASDADRGKIIEGLRAQIDEALSASQFAQLVRLTDGLVAEASKLPVASPRVGDDESGGGTIAGRLPELAAGVDVRLGRWSMEDGDPESAVFYWERAARRSVSSAAGREALGRLAVVYAAADSGWPAAPAEAVRVLGLLQKHHARATMPSTLLAQGDDSVASSHVADTDDTESCKAFVDRVSALLPARAVRNGIDASASATLPRILSGVRGLEMIGHDVIPSSMLLRDAVSFYDPTTDEDHFAEVLPILKFSQIIGVRGQTRSLELAAWSNDLGMVAEDQAAVQREWGTLDVRPAAVSGRVAVLASGGRITPIGLLSGRMMWPSTFIDPDGGALPEPPVVHADGIIIIATHANTLVALPARQGAQPIWRRRFSGRPLGTLAVVRGHLAVIDASGETLTLLDPHSGRVRRQYGLLVPAQTQEESQVREVLMEALRVARAAAQDDDSDSRAADADVHTAIVGSMVCRSGFKRVVGRDIETGRTIWELPTAGLVTGLLSLNDRYVGVCHGRNRMEVVDAETGTVAKSIQAKGLVMPPQDAVVDPPPASLGSAGDRLILFTRSTGEPTEYTLACFPFKEGEPGWRQELGPLATVSRRMLRASPDYLAAVVYEFRADRLIAGQQPQWQRGVTNVAAARLFVFDKGDRRRMIESPFTFDFSPFDERTFTGLISDVVVLDDRIIAIGPDGYYVLQAGEDQSAMNRPEPDRSAKEAAWAAESEALERQRLLDEIRNRRGEP